MQNNNKNWKNCKVYTAIARVFLRFLIKTIYLNYKADFTRKILKDYKKMGLPFG